MPATTLHPTAADHTLYGHPPGSTISPNQTESFPSSWPWYVYVIGTLVVILIILTCMAIGFSVYEYLNHRRNIKEAQRLADIEAAARTRNSPANHPSQILPRDLSSSTTVALQRVLAPLAQVYDINSELYEYGSSWRIKTITAWANDIPEDAGLDTANLEIQLWRSRLHEEVWMVRGPRLDRPKVMFAPNLPTREHVTVNIGDSQS